MTNDSRRCLIVPISLAGLVAMWGGAVLLIAWDTLGAPDVTGKWGLLASAAAAAWTVIYGLARQHQLMVEAFELGRRANAAGRGLRRVDASTPEPY